MPSSCVFSRSTLARSCCVLAEYVVASPVSSGRSRAFFRKSCITPSSATGSPVPVSWIQNSKPPVVPMPGIAGGAIGMTIAPSMLARLREEALQDRARVLLLRGVDVLVALVEVLERDEDRRRRWS